jgi:hypothetical protein
VALIASVDKHYTCVLAPPINTTECIDWLMGCWLLKTHAVANGACIFRSRTSSVISKTSQNDQWLGQRLLTKY